MKSGALLLSFLLISPFCFSQDYGLESLLYSHNDLLGTARTAGAGGAFGSVGADLGSLSINPAGIGLYHSDDISITPGLRFTANQGNYEGSTSSGQVPIAFLSQAGIEFTWQSHNFSGQQMGFTSHSGSLLRSVSLAINYHHDNVFARNDNLNYYDVPSGSGLMDYFAAYANYYGGPVTPEMDVANQLGLFGINPAANNTYTSSQNGPYNQSGSLQTRGGIDNISLDFGGNINDKVFFGLSLDVPILRLVNTSSFAESYAGDSASIFQSYNMSSQQVVTGGGIGGSLGLIYRPTTWMRLGVAYHLPTWYFLTDNYTINSFNLYADTIPGGSEGIDPYSFQPADYTFRTPMKGVFSASFYYKDYGFLSIDYSLQNFGASRFYSPDNSLPVEQGFNDSLKTWFGFSHTIHAGLEIAYKLLRIRAGYAISTSPVKSTQSYYVSGYNFLQQNITAGIGVRLKRFYIDFAYIYGFTKDYSLPFDNYYLQVNNRYTTSTLLLTVGWKLQPKSSSSLRRRPQPQQPTYNNNNYQDYRDGY